jgi:hypothetical protein
MDNNKKFDSVTTNETNPIRNFFVLIAIVLLMQSCAEEHYWKGGGCINNKGVVGIRYDFAK